MRLTLVDSWVQMKGSLYVPVKKGRQSQVITSAGSNVSDLVLSIGPRMFEGDKRSSLRWMLVASITVPLALDELVIWGDVVLSLGFF